MSYPPSFLSKSRWGIGKLERRRQPPPLIELLGVATVALLGIEIHSRLGKGVIDGVTWPSVGINDMRFSELASYLLRPTLDVPRPIILMCLRDLPGGHQNVFRALWHLVERVAQDLSEELARQFFYAVDKVFLRGQQWVSGP